MRKEFLVVIRMFTMLLTMIMAGGLPVDAVAQELQATFVVA